jgi:3',5'-cyclic AMP phosphodiesterase CpdA
MRTIVHLSDLHFGRVDEATLEPLIQSVTDAKPDLVVVSGDLTQRARTAEFQAAKAFLDRLPQPQMVVPGNHDIPMHNPLTRFVAPLAKYRASITDDLEPFYCDEALAVVGLNTARSLTVKDGRINDSQIMRTHERLQNLGPDVAKVVVTHHPFDLPSSHSQEAVVGRSHKAMEVFASCGVDMFLAGHFHVIHAGQTAERYKIDGHSALVVQAGTATSTRVRGELNSFNVIVIDLPSVVVDRYTWDAGMGGFAVSASERFLRGERGWLPH